MQAAIQFQPAVTQRAGVGRYTRELAEHLARLLAPSDSLRLDYFDFRGAATIPSIPHADLHPVRWVPGRIIQQAWKYTPIPRYECIFGKADLFHFPNFIAPPVRHGKKIVSIHDLSFIRFPHFADVRNMRYLNRRIRDTTARVDAVITISHFSAHEIETYLQVPLEKIYPIHLGISPAFRAPPDADIAHFRQQATLQRPYLLSVGTLEPRKNIPFLIELYENMPDYDGDLVLVGGEGWHVGPILERIARSPRAASIRCLGFVEDQNLPALYAGADAFLLASFYEGFGFPPLEAMACSTPVFSSTGGSLAEVLGDGAVLFDHYHAKTWAKTILSTLSNREACADLAIRGQQVAASYTWEKTAAETLAIYQKVLS